MYIGTNPYATTFLSSHLWCLADLTLHTHTILIIFGILLGSCDIWGIRKSCFLSGVSVVGALILQSWDTMSLIKADLWFGVWASEVLWINSNTPREPTLYPLFTSLCTGELNAIRKQKCFLCSPFYGRACRWHMLGEIKP
jgi:hypothetical protein